MLCLAIQSFHFVTVMSNHTATSSRGNHMDHCWLHTNSSRGHNNSCHCHSQCYNIVVATATTSSGQYTPLLSHAATRCSHCTHSNDVHHFATKCNYNLHCHYSLHISHGDTHTSSNIIIVCIGKTILPEHHVHP